MNVEEERKFEIPRIDVFDDVFYTMAEKYGGFTAIDSIYKTLTTYNYNYITRTNNARENFSHLSFEEIFHVIANYAVSSFILNERPVNYSYKDFNTYAINNNKDLVYNKENARDIFAIAVAISPFWASNIFACNKPLANKLIESFVDERYRLDRMDELDNIDKSKIIKFTDSKDMILLSKYNLNSSCREMKKVAYEENGRIR